MKFSSFSHRVRKGFTLIELMVVVAILSVLIGVASPIYMSYLAKSDRLACAGNMKELFAMGTLYSADHYGILPCSGMKDNSTTPWDESKGWWVALTPYIFTEVADRPTSKTDPVRINKYFRCPSDDRSQVSKSESYPVATEDTVSYASWTDNSENPRNPRSGIQISRGTMISGVPWLSDGLPQPDQSVKNEGDYESWIVPALERHNGYIIVLYADGLIKEIEDPTFELVAPTLAGKK